ncbi:MAG: glycosyltransferase [Bacteroidales bacterium]|nr:glycosyltransferase [Bacteroidales bacterium]
MVSVIVPVYNAQNYLEDAINSILGQTECDLELILVDDGSTDDSLKICNAAAKKDNRVVILTTPHAGVSAARNAGIDISKGEFITFVDADDMLNPRFLEILLTDCNATDEISMAYQSQVPAEAMQTPSADSCKKITLSGIKAAEESLYQKVILNSPWGKIYSRGLFFNPDLRFRRGIRFEDLEIATPLLCRASKVTIFQMPLYFYRDTPGGFMNSDSDSRTDCLTVTADTVKWASMNEPSLIPAAISRQVSAALHIFRWVNTRRPDLKSIAADCYRTIVSHRRKLLFNPNVRLKNKVALAASYLGAPALSFFSRLS